MNCRRCPVSLALTALVLLGLVALTAPAGAQADCLDVSGALQVQPDGSAIVTGDLAGTLAGLPLLGALPRPALAPL